MILTKSRCALPFKIFGIKLITNIFYMEKIYFKHIFINDKDVQINDREGKNEVFFFGNMNAIKPSMREKRRYICFNVDTKLPKSEIKNLILSRIKKWVGEKNFDLARIKFISYERGLGLLACNHKQYLDVRMGIMLSKAKVFAVSGMVKKAKEKIKDYHK